MSDTYDSEIQLFRNGLTTTIKIKSFAYDTVEFSIKKHLVDEEGKVLVDSGYTNFFSHQEFKDFFQPLVNDLKVRFDHADSIQE